MRVTRQTQAANRSAILTEAEKLFRSQGIGGVGVADITRAAGLTHGAFYGHFPSKTALAAESCRHSLLQAAEKWRARAAQAREAGQDPVGVLIDRYLTEQHRDAPENGCTLAALGAETVRDPELRAAMAEGTAALVAALAEAIGASRQAAEPEAAALAVLAAMNGGLLMARALVDHPDLSRAALQRAAILARQAAG